MKPLEDELKSALKGREAPEGFSGRVMARVAAEPRRRRTWYESLASLFRYTRLRWAATAALAVVTGAGVWMVRRHEERVKAAAARRQVMFALHFAGSKLNLAMRQASGIERRRSELGNSDNSQ